MDTDTTALIGIGLGAAGILTSGVSLLYFREQAAAARRQAEEARRQSESATRLALMESNLHMYGRFRETRNRFLDHPNLEKEWRDSHPTFSATFDACGGLDEFVAVRDAMDTMQDVYFLRRGGSVTDHYWHVWTRTFFRFYSKMPTFLLVFEFAAKEGLLHPDFVGFYRPLIQGQPLKDPAPPA